MLLITLYAKEILKHVQYRLNGKYSNPACGIMEETRMIFSTHTKKVDLTTSFPGILYLF